MFADEEVDPYQLLQYAHLSQLSYLDNLDQTNIQLDLSSKGNRQPIITPIRFIDNGAQCWLYLTHGGKDGNTELIICYRGTDSIEDAVTNVNMLPVDFVALNSHSCGKVHKGYLEYYHQLRHATLLEIQRFVKRYYTLAVSNNTRLQVAFIGHSLGGSSVLLPALEAAYMLDQRRVDIKCITFGAPAMGNHKFCESFNNKLCHMIRVVYDSDLVPRLPILHNHTSSPICIKGPEEANMSYKNKNSNPFNLRFVEHHSMDSYIRGLRSFASNKIPIRKPVSTCRVVNGGMTVRYSHFV